VTDCDTTTSCPFSTAASTDCSMITTCTATRTGCSLTSEQSEASTAATCPLSWSWDMADPDGAAYSQSGFQYYLYDPPFTSSDLLSNTTISSPPTASPRPSIPSTLSTVIVSKLMSSSLVDQSSSSSLVMYGTSGFVSSSSSSSATSVSVDVGANIIAAPGLLSATSASTPQATTELSPTIPTATTEAADPNPDSPTTATYPPTTTTDPPTTTLPPAYPTPCSPYGYSTAYGDCTRT
jgi:hypothetical protein